MATLVKQMLMGLNTLTVDKATAVKTIAFDLDTILDEAGRVSGGASLVEAQVEASHGAFLAARLKKKFEATKKAVAEAIQCIEMTRQESNSVIKYNSVPNEEATKPVDPDAFKRRYRSLAYALREAANAARSVVQTTDPSAPSSLKTKEEILEKVYLTAKKISTYSLGMRPTLLTLNKVVAQREAMNKGRLEVRVQ